MVHWSPPEVALQAAQAALADPSIHGYGPADGWPPLLEALADKLEAQNGLPRVSGDAWAGLHSRQEQR